jgi:hypothetical protein
MSFSPGIFTSSHLDVLEDAFGKACGQLGIPLTDSYGREVVASLMFFLAQSTQPDADALSSTVMLLYKNILPSIL